MTGVVQPVIGFPQITEPMVDDNGALSRPWYQFLRGLWLRFGGAIANPITGLLVDSGAVVLAEVEGQEVALVSGAYDANTGDVTVSTPIVGAAAIPQVLGASPFIFTAAFQGTLIVQSAQVEISRNAGANWYLVNATGGAIPMLTGDKVRVTWYGVGVGNRPTVTFLPGGA